MKSVNVIGKERALNKLNLIKQSQTEIVIDNKMGNKRVYDVMEDKYGFPFMIYDKPEFLQYCDKISNKDCCCNCDVCAANFLSSKCLYKGV